MTQILPFHQDDMNITSLGRSYIENGFVLVEDLISKEEREEIRTELIKINRGDYPCASITPEENYLTDDDLLTRYMYIGEPHVLSPTLGMYIKHPGICRVLDMVVGAGAICWFEKGVTDSWASNLNIMDCMGFLKGCCCPHYDGEADRKPSLEKYLLDGVMESCYALDDGSALHYNNGKLHTAISFYKDAKAWKVSLKHGNIHHSPIKGVSLI